MDSSAMRKMIINDISKSLPMSYKGPANGLLKYISERIEINELRRQKLFRFDGEINSFHFMANFSEN